jgi:hypothetical protein
MIETVIFLVKFFLCLALIPVGLFVVVMIMAWWSRPDR